MTGGSPQPKRLKRSSSGINEANDSSSSSSSASANQFSFSGVCDLNNKNNTTTTGISTTLPSASGSSSSLSTFWNLPQEIKDRIFTLACSLPSADVASLALASPIFHAQANAALWSNVRITRPSALTRLHDTIAARPELGVRVKNLHVGPEEEAPYREPHRWQPTANGPSSISTSLRTAKEGQLLPQWCAPGQEWRAEPPATDCCRSNAVFEALQEVQRSLKLELINNGFWRAHPSLPRVYEAQAALDLYLIHMRRIEDAEIHAAAKRPSCSHDGNCPPYPPLLIIGTAAQPEKPELGANDANQPYTLTRQQLLDHIDRRGGPQDSFDHPVIVARSDLNPASLRAPGASPTRWRPDSRYESDSFEFVSTSGSESLNYWQSGPPVRAFDSYSLRETLRKLLRQLPKLENLSLTGLLSYRCGTFGAGRGVVSPALKSFSMGPPPRIRRWYGDRLDFQRYKHIESLHLCGLFPAGEHIAKVGSLKRLQHFRWTLTDDLAEEELFRLGVILDALTGRKGAAADAAAAKANDNKRNNNLQPAVLKKLRAQTPRQAAQRKASRGSTSRGSTSRGATPQEEDGSEATGINSNSHLPLIEVRLRPEALLAILNRAATQEERAAWSTGTLWPGCKQTRRLLLTEVPAVRSFTSEGKPQHPLFEAAREWWEEHRAI